MKRLSTSTVLAALAAVSGLGMAATANADTQVAFTFTGPDSTYSEGITLSNAVGTGLVIPGGGSTLPGAQAGIYDTTVNGKATLAYCVDVNHDINGSNSPYTGDATTLVGAYDTTKSPLYGSNFYSNGGLDSGIQNPGAGYQATNLGAAYNTVSATYANALQREIAASYLAQYLAVNTYTFASGTVKDNQAAVSLAIWDIVQDGQAGDISSGSATIDGLATGYENWALGLDNTAGESNVLWLQAPDTNANNVSQEFMYLDGTPPPHPPQLFNIAPEPGVLVTSFSLMGLVGGGLLKGRRRAGARKAA